jgi:hypothetical protein
MPPSPKRDVESALSFAPDSGPLLVVRLWSSNLSCRFRMTVGHPLMPKVVCSELIRDRGRETATYPAEHWGMIVMWSLTCRPAEHQIRGVVTAHPRWRLS